LWFGDFKFAQLAFFILSLIHFCGRGSEVAVVQFHRIFLKTPSEFLDAGEVTDQIANVSLYRTKTKGQQDLAVFNHRDCFLMCWYFMFGYSMVLNESDTMPQSLFPLFVRNVKVDQSEAATVESLDSAAEADNAAFTAEMGAHGVTVSPDATEAKGVSQLFKNLLQQVGKSASALTIARNNSNASGKTGMASSTESGVPAPPCGDEVAMGLLRLQVRVRWRWEPRLRLQVQERYGSSGQVRRGPPAEAD
jgi:hypothetical protein